MAHGGEELGFGIIRLHRFVLRFVQFCVIGLGHMAKQQQLRRDDEEGGEIDGVFDRFR